MTKIHSDEIHKIKKLLFKQEEFFIGNIIFEISRKITKVNHIGLIKLKCRLSVEFLRGEPFLHIHHLPVDEFSRNVLVVSKFLPSREGVMMNAFMAHLSRTLKVYPHGIHSAVSRNKEHDQTQDRSVLEIRVYDKKKFRDAIEKFSG